MKNTLFTICILSSFSCNQISNTDSNEKNAVNDSITMDETVSNDFEDCVFDLSTQDDSFMEQITDYPNYTWDDENKTATVVLENGDTIKITRGGCVHYNNRIEFITRKTDSLTIDNPEFGLNLAMKLSQKIFPPSDFELLSRLVNNESFEYYLSINQRYIQLQQDLYCDMSIVMEENELGQFRLEIGYYLC